MRSILRYFCALFFCLVVSTTAIQAQDLPDVALGLQPYVAYHGGELDSVSTLNGGLTVRIPLISYPQKGSSLSLSYSVIFNSFGFQDLVICDAAADPNGPDSTIPLHDCPSERVNFIPTGVVTSGLDAPIAPRIVVDQQLIPAGTREPIQEQVTNPPVQGRYYVVTADGAQHPLGRSSDGIHFRSVDEAGYQFIPSSPTDYPWNLGSANQAFPGDTSIKMGGVGGTITDSHGTVYIANTSITDVDNNQISFASGGTDPALPFTTTDSTNRIIPASVATSDISKCPTNIPGTTLQPLVSASTWTPPGTTSDAPYIFCYASVNISTNYPKLSKSITQVHRTLTMLQSIVLPNKQFWGFVYDSADPNAHPSVGLGELMTLIYPTGGQVNYTYGVFGGFCSSFRPSGLNPAGASVNLYAQQVQSRTMKDSTGAILGTWNYGYGDFESGAQTATGSIMSPPSILPSTGDLTITKFQLDPNNGEPDLACHFLDAGKMVYQGSSATGTPLQDTTTTYTWPTPPGLPSVSVPREYQTTTVLNGVSTSTITKSYDPGISFAEETCNIDGTNCGVGTPAQVTIGGPILTTYTDKGIVLKQEATTYQWKNDTTGTYLAANLLDIPYMTKTEDGSGSPIAYTSYSYDESCGLRGHVSTITPFLNINSGPAPIAHTGWNCSGQKIYTIDPDQHANNNGHTVDYYYGAPCNNSLVTSTTNALNQSSVGTYDCNTGALTSFTDANSNTSGFTYDSMRRILTASYPDGGSTTFSYADPQNTVTRTILATPNPSLTTSVIFDGFGREIHRIMSDVPQSDTIDTTYDLNGRAYSVSNPYRSTGDPTYGLTTFIYDALGRKKVETEADGTSQLSWSYSGNTTTSTDEDGNSWARTHDSLGRLTTVVEPTALATSYSYNPMGDLTNVNQFGVANVDNPRLRSFVYDSLSRLITANNPETGTICYGQWNGTNCINGYDANGNLLAKTDARNITTYYVYDSLNRTTSKTYSDSTPPASYTYDTPNSNHIGRLSSGTVGSGANAYSYYFYIYDKMGRLTQKNFQFPNATGNGLTPNGGAAGDAYDLAGHVIVTNVGTGAEEYLTRDSAGHVSNVTTNVGGFPLFNNATYSPLGGLVSRSQTNSLTETRSYDKRGNQTSTIQSASGSSVGYSVATGYDPVGNVTSVNDTVNGNWTYAYDPLNRLHQASSAAGLNLDWEYDAFGNRLSQTPSGTGSAPQVSFPFSGNNNRADASSGIVYDAAGNVLVDNLGQRYTYDAEERISSVTPYLGGTVTYQYDSEGNLVYENTGNSTQVFLRNAAGQPVFILPATGSSGPFNLVTAYADGELVGTLTNNTFYWAAKDTVGTKRFTSGALNNGPTPYVAETFTSLPFGDALSSIGISPLHFTGKERDAESGLDYFGARYYTSTMGRWMSPDWASKPEAVPYSSLDNPQSLNLYGYVLNNPLSHADADGHCCDPMDVLNFAAGAANAFGSDNLLGAGRVNQTTSAGQLGAAVGDLGAMVQGAAQVVLGTGGNIAGVALDATGVGAAVGAPVNVVSTAVTAEGAGAATMGATNLMRAGGNFSQGTKQAAKDAAGGKCQNCGVETTPGQKSQKGVTPPGTQGEGDHIIPKSKGGTNGSDNIQHPSRDCNQQKGDKLPGQQ